LEDGLQSRNSAPSGPSRPVDDLASLFDSPQMSAPTAAPLQQQSGPSVLPIFSSPIPGMSPNSMGMNNSNSVCPMSTSSNSFTGSSYQGSPRPQQFGSIMLPGTPQPQGQMAEGMGLGRMTSPSYFNGGPNLPPQTMALPLHPQRQQSAMSSQNQNQNSVRQSGSGLSTASSNPPTQGKDPFADLVGLF